MNTYYYACTEKDNRLKRLVNKLLKTHTELELANLINDDKIKLPSWVGYEEGLMRELTLTDKKNTDDDDSIVLRLEILDCEN